MYTSCKYTARLLADALYEYGVRDVVVSPGSRNTPLILALEATELLRKHIVIDERSAAFAALGMSLQGGRPVACICTSGSAVLNYGPALAEAFYRCVPLIVISADRPLEWIDQDDSQTLHQHRVLDNIVKASYDIAVDEATTAVYVNRILNDALTMAISRRRGPVHINMQFGEPLGETVDCADSGFRLVSHHCTGSCSVELPEPEYNRIMIVAGFHSPDGEYSQLLYKLRTECGMAVLCEAQSNVDGIGAAPALKALGHHESAVDYAPGLVISTGGGVVSKELKRYLRETPLSEHWYVGYGDYAVDCYRRLTRRFDMDEKTFLKALYKRYSSGPKSDFGERWSKLHDEGTEIAREYTCRVPWSDMVAVRMLLESCPESEGRTLHLSNGTAVRYAQYCSGAGWRAVECNRGVSGIDGSVSTAIGAAVAGGKVLLICGDMSAQYDMGALAMTEIPDDFRMVVLDNSGGGIFRVIGSTAGMCGEMRERYYSGNINLPLRQLADGFGFDYYEVASAAELRMQYPRFLGAPRKAIMRVVTDAEVSAEVFKAF